ncbi:MAG: DinB family protein [Actinomycetota bacterium]|nr:DinB family protein [Actinomycetota bacterium]
MAIEPDAKSWAWVLERPCPDCAYDSSAVVLRDIGMSIRDIASQWEVILLHPGATKRPVENVWSPSEYGCHVRDVMRMADFRLELMTTEDDPMFTNWNQDETAVAERYDLQDPLIVRRELAIAGDLLAERFDAITAGQWSRSGLRSDGTRFTVESFSRYFLHDPIHHLWDVSRTY